MTLSNFLISRLVSDLIFFFIVWYVHVAGMLLVFLIWLSGIAVLLERRNP